MANITTQHLIEVACSAILFIVIWQILSARLFKPYLALLDERDARTVGDEQRVVERKKEIEDVQRVIDDELRQARVEGIVLRDKLVNEAKEEAQAIIDEATKVVDEELSRSRQAIFELKTQARAEIDKEADKLALLVVDRLQSSGNEKTVH